MAEKSYEVAYEFPDEQEAKEVKEVKERVQSKEAPSDVDIEVVDDVPAEDKDPSTGKVRAPMPKEIVEELEKDDLESYSEGVKERLKQMKKVWHDERRAKEAALREQQQAIEITKKIMEENKRLREFANAGQQTFIDTAKNAVELELEMAKRAYKEAYDSGDSDAIVEAQSKLAEINYKRQQVLNYRATPLQPTEVEVNSDRQGTNVPTPDTKTLAWQERNPWWGNDPEMTALALGFHQKLERQHGSQYVGTDDYWADIDKTMRRRFPDYFGEEEQPANGGGKPVRSDSKPATVVAPASRSTSSKRIVLKQSEVALAKKFGLTPEQYAREKMRLENQNG
jgi:hypothetical protein